MATPGGLVDKQELIDAQLDTAHLGRVVNSKDASGAPISTSTNRTGGVNKTLDALEGEYLTAIRNAGGTPLNGGVWATGQTFTAYNQFMVYNGIPYKPKTSTSLPYVAQGSDPTISPDDENVQPYQEVTESRVVEIINTELPATIPLYTDVLYKASGGNSAVENMVSDLALNPLMYAVGTVIKTGGTTWEYIDSTGPITSENFRAFNCLNIIDFGAVPDAQLSNGNENPAATDSTSAIQSALDLAAAQPNRKDVFVPAGFYKITSALILPYVDIGPRFGPKLKGESMENSVIIGNQFDMIDFSNTFRGVYTFEDIGFWGRPRNPAIAWVGNHSGRGFFNDDTFVNPNEGVLRPVCKRVAFRYFDTCIDIKNGGWNTKISECLFAASRLALYVNRFYSAVIEKTTFLTGSALYSDGGLYASSMKDCEISLGGYVAVDGTNGPYNIIDINPQIWDMDTIYAEIYGTPHPDSIFLNIRGNGGSATYKNFYINPASAEMILRKHNNTVVTTDSQATYDKIFIASSNQDVIDSWWTTEPGSAFLFYKYDSVPNTLERSDNTLFPQNNSKNSIVGNYSLDLNDSSQKLDLSAIPVVTNSNQIRNVNWIDSTGSLKVHGGLHRVTISPLTSIPEFTAGKKLKASIQNQEVTLYDGDESTSGKAGVITIWTGNSTAGGLARDIELTTEGFTGQTDVTINFAISIECEASQRTSF